MHYRWLDLDLKKKNKFRIRWSNSYPDQRSGSSCPHNPRATNTTRLPWRHHRNTAGPSCGAPPVRQLNGRAHPGPVRPSLEMRASDWVAARCPWHGATSDPPPLLVPSVLSWDWPLLSQRRHNRRQTCVRLCQPHFRFPFSSRSRCYFYERFAVKGVSGHARSMHVRIPSNPGSLCENPVIMEKIFELINDIHHMYPLSFEISWN